MAAVQADLLALPPTAGRIAVRGDRHPGRLAKGCGVMRVPVMEVGRPVGAMHRSHSMMGHEPMARVRIVGPREESLTREVRSRGVIRKAALRVGSSSNGLRGMIFRRALRATGGLAGYQYRRSARRAMKRPVIHPTRPKARSGCMVTMQLLPHCRTRRAGCAGYLLQRKARPQL